MSFPLSEFLDFIPESLILDSVNPSPLFLENISSNSRNIAEKSLFIAVKGVNVDGDSFIDEVIEKGAVAIFTESDLDFWQKKYPEIVFFQTSNCRLVNSLACQFMAGGLSRMNFHLNLIGVTGTNGKTTSAYLFYQILQNFNEKCGLLSTITYFDGKNFRESSHTTPPPEKLFPLLTQCEVNGCNFVPMEISSHSLAQFRLGKLKFKIAIFTNLTGEHLDFHKDMENYYQTKKSLFINHAENAIINTDSVYGVRLASELRSETDIKVVTFGTENNCDYQLKITADSNKSEFTLNQVGFESNLLGRYNIYNLVGVIVGLAVLGYDLKILSSVVKNSKFSVPGRLELITLKNGAKVFIDYAHTDDALKNVLTNLQELPHEQLIVVFGCGGDRDKFKRARMGEVATTYADYAIITSDNPRSEDPFAIIEEIKKGIKPGRKFEIIENRADAIRKSLEISKNGDIVLIAGKGHETYHEINGQKSYFSDSQEVRKFEDEK